MGRVTLAMAVVHPALLTEAAKARHGAEVWPEPSQYPFVTLES